MKGNAAEERMGRGVRRMVSGIGNLLSGKKSKPKTTKPRRRQKRKPAFSQDGYKAKMKSNRRSF